MINKLGKVSFVHRSKIIGNFCTKQTNKTFKSILEDYKNKVAMMTSEPDDKLVEKFGSKLSKEQKDKVEKMVDFTNDFNDFQFSYLTILKQENELKKKSMSLFQMNVDWNGLAKTGDKCPEDISSAYFKQQEFMANFVPWLAKQQKPDLGLGPAVSAVQQEVKKDEKKEEKKEVKEKATYDIELVSFDAAKKVNLIKEVRAFANLGLKESKELVEKAPTIILKGINKEDTEAIIKKLSEAGGKLVLK